MPKGKWETTKTINNCTRQLTCVVSGGGSSSQLDPSEPGFAFANFVHVIDMIGTVDVISHIISFLRILALEGETMEILVTGFDPFDGEPINSLGSRKTP